MQWLLLGQAAVFNPMTLPRINFLAIGITLLAIVFILTWGVAHGPIFWHLLVVHDLPATWLMLVMLVFSYLFSTRISGGCVWVERLLLTLDRQRYLAAAVLWVVLCAGSLWIYRNHPLSMDEYAAVFQAKIFAAGAMHGQFPPDLLDYLIPHRFQNYFLMVNRSTGAVFSAYWPGFSLLLAPFVWLGIPWACNPTLVAASFLLIGRIARDLSDSPLAAGWAMLFALASPAFVANGITYYSMAAHLLFNLGFAWLLLSPSPLRLFLAGLAGGFALVLHNPFPHVVFALPWIIWLATTRGQRMQNLAFLVAGYLPIVLLLGVGWSLWLQDTVRAGVQAAGAPQAAGLAAPDLFERLLRLLRGFLNFLTFPDEEILYARLGGLAKLWLWASPLLLLLAWLGWRGNTNPRVGLLGASAMLTFFSYFLIRFDQGHGWGYRYFHSAWGVLPILATLGAVRLAAADGPRVFRQLALLALLSLVLANALRFAQMGDFMASHLAQFPPRVADDQRVVLHNGLGYYAYDLIQNDPWLRGEEIVLIARRAEKGELARTAPGYTGNWFEQIWDCISWCCAADRSLSRGHRSIQRLPWNE
jgi:hypothetical protein